MIPKRTSLLPTLLFLLLSLSAHAQQTDTLIAGYNIAAPFVFERNGELQGVSVWLWDEVEATHDLPCKFVRLPLDSLLRGLERGTVDLSLSPLTITSERAERMDFSPPYYIAHSSILTRSASALEKSLVFIGSFFSVNFFRALGALALVILLFGLVEWLFERRANEEEFGPGWRGLWNGFWWSAVTMTTVGYGDKSPRTVGGRIVALVWMFTAIIIISGFTASIASSLTVNQLGWAQNRIEDFKDDRLGTIRDSGTESWLNTNFYTNKVEYGNMTDLMAALASDEIDAIAYDRPILQEALKTDTMSQFEVLPINYNAQFYAMGFRRGLPDTLKREISTAILETTERMDWKVILAEYGLEWK